MTKNSQSEKKILCFLLLIIIIISCCNKNIDNSKLQNAQWNDDINLLVDTLVKNHPNLYDNITKDDFYKRVDDIKKDIPKLSDAEIRLRLKQIVASIGDAHTLIFSKTDLRICSDYQENVYPIILNWFGNELRVTEVTNKYNKILGKKLIKINKVPIQNVMEKVNTLISYENNQWAKQNNKYFIRLPEVLRYLEIADEHKSVWSFQDDNGNIIELSILPDKLMRDEMIKIEDSINVIPIKMQRSKDDFYGFWYKYIHKDRILYFQYNSCFDKTNGKDDSLPDFKKFKSKLVDTINNCDVDKLVIDMRENEGGFQLVLKSFIRELPKIKKLQGKGRIFVIVGKRTFSAAVLNCLDIKNCTPAIFVGEETGGRGNDIDGSSTSISLPNSKLIVHYSTFHLYTGKDRKEGLIPDIQIDQSFENYCKGIDNAYEAIKKYDK